MHGRQINPYEISHFARCNTLVLISITHSIQCNYAFYPKGGVALCTHARAERGRKAGVGHRSGSCSVMYTENLAIYVISVCDFNQRQSSGTTKITQHLLKKETERAGEWDVERDANWNRVTAPAPATASGRSPSPASLPRRVSNFLAPGLGTVLYSLVWFGSVLNFN